MNAKSAAGYVLVTVALVLVGLMGFAALAVDVGVLNSARTSAQRAADAAALAGAFTFVKAQTAPQPSTAENQARQTALSNTILGAPIASGDVTIDVNVANRLVTVTVRHIQETFFAKVLGQNSANIAATAYAEASFNATGTACAKPWFIPNTVLSGLPPCDTTSGSTTTPGACSTGQLLIQNGQPTSFALSQIGSQFTIKPNKPDDAMGPGNFYAVQLPGSIGGNEYRQNIARCTDLVSYCTSTYSVETGNMVGPTLQGVRDLIGSSPDTFVAAGRYRRAEGTLSDTSPQVIVGPIWDTCNVAGFCPDNHFPKGTNVSLGIVGFAMVFLDGVQGNNVRAHLLGVSACGAGGGGGGGGGPAPPETGPYSIPVRLVRVQQQ